jgi:hypothetical protein
MDLLNLIITLVLGGYVFTAGGYVFSWKIYKELSNHQRTALKRHLRGQCDDDCYFCN